MMITGCMSWYEENRIELTWLPGVNTKISSYFAICQMGKKHNVSVSFTLDNCSTIKLFVDFCQVLREPVELACSAKNYRHEQQEQLCFLISVSLNFAKKLDMNSWNFEQLV